MSPEPANSGNRLDADDGDDHSHTERALRAGTPFRGSLAAARDDFFLARATKKHSEHTLAAYRRDIDVITKALTAEFGTSSGELMVVDLDVRALRVAFGTIAHQAASTIARTWSTWNQLFGFLVAEGELAGNPMAAVQKPKGEKQRPKSIGGDDSIQRLLEVAATGRDGARYPWPERDFALFVLFLTCGLRLSEFVDLNFGSIEGPPGERVLGVRGKGNKERTIPIEPEVEALIERYLLSRESRFPDERRVTYAPLFVDHRGHRMQRGSLQYLVDATYRAAGIRNRVPKGALVHALRHTFATNVARAGASGTELQQLLGHESLATTQRYIDVTAREIRTAARANEAYATIADVVADADLPKAP